VQHWPLLAHHQAARDRERAADDLRARGWGVWAGVSQKPAAAKPPRALAARAHPEAAAGRLQRSSRPAGGAKPPHPSQASRKLPAPRTLATNVRTVKKLRKAGDSTPLRYALTSGMPEPEAAGEIRKSERLEPNASARLKLRPGRVRMGRGGGGGCVKGAYACGRQRVTIPAGAGRAARTRAGPPAGPWGRRRGSLSGVVSSWPQGLPACLTPCAGPRGCRSPRLTLCTGRTWAPSWRPRTRGSRGAGAVAGAGGGEAAAAACMPCLLAPHPWCGPLARRPHPVLPPAPNPPSPPNLPTPNPPTAML
jgi:hypothetical protein